MKLTITFPTCFSDHLIEAVVTSKFFSASYYPLLFLFFARAFITDLKEIVSLISNKVFVVYTRVASPSEKGTFSFIFVILMQTCALHD